MGLSVWLSEGSRWTVESVENHYITIVIYKPLKGSSYIELPTKLRNPTKGLINIKNNDYKCTLEPTEKDPQRIERLTNNILKSWIIQALNFQFHKNSITNSRNKMISISACLDVNKNNHILLIFQKKSLKIK